MKSARLMAFVILCLFCFAWADPITIGEPVTSQNCIPLGGCYGGSNYQQIYSSSAFPTALSIGTIDFFQTRMVGGTLSSGTFAFYLSSTSTAVTGLDLSSFDNNLGSDNQLFGVFTLTGGPAPSVLSFSGTPFSYDPTLGNLLLDIRVTGYSGSLNPSYYDASHNPSYSRMWEIGAGSVGYGLVTRYSTTSVPEPSTLLLLSGGLGLVAVLRKRC